MDIQGEIVYSLERFQMILPIRGRELVILSYVTGIGKSAFGSGSSLKSIIVPKCQIIRLRELLKDSGCDLSIVKGQDD